jgi:hypothetical protein
MFSTNLLSIGIPFGVICNNAPLNFLDSSVFIFEFPTVYMKIYSKETVFHKEVALLHPWNLARLFTFYNAYLSIYRAFI